MQKNDFNQLLQNMMRLIWQSNPIYMIIVCHEVFCFKRVIPTRILPSLKIQESFVSYGHLSD